MHGLVPVRGPSAGFVLRLIVSNLSASTINTARNIASVYSSTFASDSAKHDTIVRTEVSKLNLDF